MLWISNQDENRFIKNKKTFVDLLKEKQRWRRAEKT